MAVERLLRAVELLWLLARYVLVWPLVPLLAALPILDYPLQHGVVDGPPLFRLLTARLLARLLLRDQLRVQRQREGFQLLQRARLPLLRTLPVVSLIRGAAQHLPTLWVAALPATVSYQLYSQHPAVRLQEVFQQLRRLDLPVVLRLAVPLVVVVASHPGTAWVAVYQRVVQRLFQLLAVWPLLLVARPVVAYHPAP